MDELLRQFADIGFPMVITAYLLIRMETKMEALTESIRALTDKIT